PSVSSTFVLHCPASTRYLHSFPTRRSSDLGTTAVVPIVWKSLSACCTCVSVSYFPCAIPVADAPIIADVLGIVRIIGMFLPINADRKRTRLNSSHVSISYPVFYLKKKIIIL